MPGEVSSEVAMRLQNNRDGGGGKSELEVCAKKGVGKSEKFRTGGGRHQNSLPCVTVEERLETSVTYPCGETNLVRAPDALGLRSRKRSQRLRETALPRSWCLTELASSRSLPSESRSLRMRIKTVKTLAGTDT